MKILDFEQSRALFVLFFIAERGEAKIGEIVHENKGRISQSAVYRAIPILKELGLIEERELKPFPPKRVFSLTERGKQVVKKLREINELLEK